MWNHTGAMASPSVHCPLPSIFVKLLFASVTDMAKRTVAIAANIVVTTRRMALRRHFGSDSNSLRRVSTVKGLAMFTVCSETIEM